MVDIHDSEYTSYSNQIKKKGKWWGESPTIIHLKGMKKFTYVTPDTDATYYHSVIIIAD
jgi:hypothetical protein